MKLSVVNTELFKLDGGAMFGVVPKVLWSKLNPADEKNLCTWAMRCLLVESGDRKMLIDCGIGDKQSEKFFSHYYLAGPHTLQKSLAALGVAPGEITDVLLTHLHFDHVGGAVHKSADGTLTPAFPNATYYSNRKHWDWASNPNARERASFLKENFIPLEEAGLMKFVEEWEEIMPGVSCKFSYGHTEAMMIPHIKVGEQTLVYCADLFPSPHHVPLPYIMGYDIRPMVTLQEKLDYLPKAHAENFTFFFEHDPTIECGRLTKDEKGRIKIGETFSLEEFNKSLS